MTRSTVLSGLLALLLSLPFAAASRDAAKAAAGDDPLSAVQALFDAMASHDVEAARRSMLPGTRFVMVRADGTIRASSDAEFLEALGKEPKSAWRERIWSPQVAVDGPMAQVRAPYDFHLDGKFSHCGTDLFTLAKDADGWRIVAVAYTARKDGCPPGG